MYTFPLLIKKIRLEAGLTQAQFAMILDVSPVLIAMIETGQKDVSKKLIVKLANKMSVHPSSITPFLFVTDDFDLPKSTKLERNLINWGEKMQELLINDRSKRLRNA